MALPGEERLLRRSQPKSYSTPDCPDRRDYYDDKILHSGSCGHSTSAGKTLTPEPVFESPSLVAGGSRAGREEQLGRGDEDKSRLEADDQDKNGSEVQREIINRHSRFDNTVHREGAGRGRDAQPRRDC